MVGCPRDIVSFSVPSRVSLFIGVYLFCFVGLKQFGSAQTIAELWDVGQGDASSSGGNGRHPGEPKLISLSSQGNPRVQKATGSHLIS